MKYKVLEDIYNSEIFLEKDSNERDIKYYILEDCQFDYEKYFYPEVYLYSHLDKNFYNPINEKILSLINVNVKKNIELSCEKYIHVVDTPIFYFIYNTENYFHFVYDCLPYLITYMGLKKKNKIIKTFN